MGFHNGAKLTARCSTSRAHVFSGSTEVRCRIHGRRLSYVREVHLGAFGGGGGFMAIYSIRQWGSYRSIPTAKRDRPSKRAPSAEMNNVSLAGPISKRLCVNPTEIRSCVEVSIDANSRIAYPISRTFLSYSTALR